MGRLELIHECLRRLRPAVRYDTEHPPERLENSGVAALPRAVREVVVRDRVAAPVAGAAAFLGLQRPVHGHQERDRLRRGRRVDDVEPRNHLRVRGRRGEAGHRQRAAEQALPEAAVAAVAAARLGVPAGRAAHAEEGAGALHEVDHAAVQARCPEETGLLLVVPPVDDRRAEVVEGLPLDGPAGELLPGGAAGGAAPAPDPEHVGERQRPRLDRARAELGGEVVEERVAGRVLAPGTHLPVVEEQHQLPRTGRPWPPWISRSALSSGVR
mmetsp:Transcript_78993/g.223568  ORF Transcript_78993/g.223568 Transcript_78993/m.223568 type:complete len:270 (+) Transcript_78993:249-1058(+)